MFFFLLSGFLLAHLYLSRPFDRRDAAKFVVSRIARICPLYVALVVLSFFAWQMGLRDTLYQVRGLKSLMSHLLMLSGTSVLWTIPVLMAFYALFLFIWWLHTRRPVTAFVLMGMVALAVILLGYPAPTRFVYGVEVQIRFVRALPWMFAGIWMARIYRHWPGPARFQSSVFALVPFLAVVFFPENLEALFSRASDPWADTVVLAGMGAVFFLFVFLVPDHGRLAANRVNDGLARVSYPLYLVHIPLLYWASPLLREAGPLSYPVYLATALGLSVLVHELFEKPARLWLRRGSQRVL